MTKETITTIRNILITILIISFTLITIVVFYNDKQPNKKLITKDTTKIEHIQYEKNKTTYQLSNGQSIINEKNDSTWDDDNSQLKHIVINKVSSQNLSKNNIITYKKEHIKQPKFNIFVRDDNLPLNGYVYTITKIKN